jgi:hypothetical protein
MDFPEDALGIAPEGMRNSSEPFLFSSRNNTKEALL